VPLLASSPNGSVAQSTQVDKWRRRFREGGLEGLYDAPRSGAPRTISDEKVEEVVKLTLEARPAGATHWSTRLMAKRAGVGRQTVSEIWRAFGLKPHRSETFQLSRDPFFVDKVRDVVGLYMAPPDNALVLSVDEKSQIQALNRTQPVLPLRPGQLERRTPEYRRMEPPPCSRPSTSPPGRSSGRCTHGIALWSS